MKYTLNVKNLNNSIRFYNRLLGSRPATITSEYVRYDPGVRKVEVELREGAYEDDTTRMFTLVVSENDAYYSFFQKMKTFAENGPGMECIVADNHFVLSDPDTNTWIITKKELDDEEKHQISKTYHCFLEPFINNNDYGQSN